MCVGSHEPKSEKKTGHQRVKILLYYVISVPSSNQRQTQQTVRRVLAHLHNAPHHRGRILYDRDTGSCRQSSHKSGHKCGRKSIRRYLHRQKSMWLELLQQIAAEVFMSFFFQLSCFCFGGEYKLQWVTPPSTAR